MTLDFDHPLTRLLNRKLFVTQHEGHFKAQYLDDVDSEGFTVEAALGTETHTDEDGTIDVFIMPGGIAVAHFIGTPSNTNNNRWAAYETLERVERNRHIGRWATFARGYWTRVCPTEPGTYPVTSKSSAVPRRTPFAVMIDFQTRKLQRVEGVVKDVSEFTPSTHRSLWQGYWWSESIPLMVAPTAE